MFIALCFLEQPETIKPSVWHLCSHVSTNNAVREEALTQLNTTRRTVPLWRLARKTAQTNAVDVEPLELAVLSQRHQPR
jgi:hypothetical protein